MFTVKVMHCANVQICHGAGLVSYIKVILRQKKETNKRRYLANKTASNTSRVSLYEIFIKEKKRIYLKLIKHSTLHSRFRKIHSGAHRFSANNELPLSALL